MKKSTLISLLIFVCAVFIDQYSKKWAMDFASLRYNQGFIMGYYSELPESLRIISLASFAGFIFFLYICSLYLIPQRASPLNYGVSLMVGGIFGNTIDKTVLGKTIDFIPFALNGTLFSFNIADVFLWVGALMILWMMFHKDKQVWYPENTRHNVLVRPRDQLRIGFAFAVVSFCSSVALGFFSYTFFSTVFRSLNDEGSHTLTTFFLTYSVISVLFCCLAFVAGILMSHKTAGPLYAFELYINDLIMGKDRKFRLRDGDHYQDLEKTAEKLRTHFMPDKE